MCCIAVAVASMCHEVAYRINRLRFIDSNISTTSTAFDFHSFASISLRRARSSFEFCVWESLLQDLERFGIDFIRDAVALGFDACLDYRATPRARFYY